MKTFKHAMLRIFFMIELCVFVGVYLFGPSGLQMMLRLEQENEHLANKLERLAHEVEDWEKKVEVLRSGDFYKEQIARQQLQMARPGDEIYLM